MNYSEEIISEIYNLDSRSAVGYSIKALYESDDKIICVYADVGSRFFVKGKLGTNEIEIGIAEQTLVPMLGGLYHEGYIPFGIAYAPFITMRAADQIRMTIGEMGLGIKLVGGSAGLVSGNLGAASLALDDLAMMRAIPNLTIVSPSDCLSEVKLFEYAAKHNDPFYIRLTGGSLGKIYNKDFDVCSGKSNVVYGGGKDAVIYSTGSETYRSIEAAKKLDKTGIHVTVVDMLFIKPLDVSVLREYSDIENIFTVEEHNIIGGLGSAVSEYVSEKTNQRLHRIGVNDSYLYPDSYEELLKESHLDVDGIVEFIIKTLSNKDCKLNEG